MADAPDAPPADLDAAPEAGTDRIATLPNLITLIRLLCIPLFLYLLFVREARLGAAALLAVLGATDWVDGYVARHMHQVSNLGKAFDPTVDRLLLITGVVSIIVADGCPLWFGLVVVTREVVLSIWVVSIMALGAKRMDVTWWGKAGTFGIMVAFPAFLASTDTGISDGLANLFEVIAWCAAVPGLVFAMIAFVGYFPAGLRALREGRAAREQAEAAA
ncbi:CDP-alcohol phosphatidyltransferase family protein [Dermatobacter hominis]|uniref:CDP-alcohol phosphatidyltransferase family protein n=1 Tax=Dermatobacter hominis TaxID=2884263 RepID=UPI001D110AE3|nr:CDP-alcohol phosphatidyltransferase family protein [Dermatobacter hominis]UDY36336.1 CDP-alcohol phosphatidyltransferase family protein [Dermatobacter hominis]